MRAVLAPPRVGASLARGVASSRASPSPSSSRARVASPIPSRTRATTRSATRLAPRCRAAPPEDPLPTVVDSEPSTSTPSPAAAATYTERAMTPREAWRRMWTRADRYHVHGVSGAAFTALGAGVLAAWAKRDVDALFPSPDVTGSNPAGDAVAAALAAGGVPEWWPLAVASLALAGACAVSGLPLGRLRGWRKTELSARSTLFQLVLTWQALRLGPGGEALAWFDAHAWQLSLAPFAWQTLTSAYIVGFTDDDKRSAALILVGAWLFGAQVFPAAAVIARPEGVAALAAANPGLLVVWCHSLVGLVWLLNWSTLGASLRARKVVDDEGYRKWYLLRPSAAWIALFALDVAAFHPFASVGEYFLTLGGSRF